MTARGERRRRLWWVLSVVALGLALWGMYELLERLAGLGPEFTANRVALPVLSITLIVLALSLVAVLVRNLVKLVLDRKRGILGARLRAKLVFFLVGFVLVPALVMVYGSSAVIKKSVEALVRTPVEEIGRHSRAIVDAWNDTLLARATSQAESIAATIDGVPVRRAAAVVEGRVAVTDVDFVAVVRDGRAVIARFAASPERSPELRRTLLRDATALAADLEGPAVARLTQSDETLIAQAAAPAGSSVVVVGIAHAHPTAARMRQIAEQSQQYRRFRVDRDDTIRLYLTLIGLVLLGIVFLATWIGITVGKRITEPIQEVAAAAREISAGNLDVRVQSRTGDEVGVLVDSFNEMAAELQESREVISRSNADLRRSNRALDLRRRYIETLVANLSTAVISLDVEGRVTTANPSVRRILGDAAVEVGEEVREILARPELAPLADLMHDMRVSELEDTRRDVTLSLDRGTVHVSVQVSTLRGLQSERLGTLVMIEDLTDLLRAQRAAAWREVARRIAHEIKNPLTPIQLSAQRLRKKSAEGAPDLGVVIDDATDSIEREVAGLKHLVDEFSRFARMPEVSPQPVDVREIVDSVLALYRGQPDIAWDVEIDPRVGRVHLDPAQMRRALINLVENAIAAMRGEGRIAVRVTDVPEKGRFRIEVADDGPGIAPADRDRLFVPYFSTKPRGTGLGLAIVHRVVTEHRGSIRVEDNAPRGAKFILEMPA